MLMDDATILIPLTSSWFVLPEHTDTDQFEPVRHRRWIDAARPVLDSEEERAQAFWQMLVFHSLCAQTIKMLIHMVDVSKIIPPTKAKKQ